MRGGNVKITIVQRLLQALTPDLCYSCGKTGALFCSYCKYDITHESLFICVFCNTPSPRGLCDEHRTALDAVYVVGAYEGGLEKALKGLKFHNDKFAATGLAELIDEKAPHFPSDAYIVPVPTLRKNIRRRGYDQALLIAKAFARLRKHPYKPLVLRNRQFVQHDTKSRQEREKQVQAAFVLNPSIPIPKTVVLVDDIITTGATIQEIARILKDSGVQTVYAVAVAHPR